MKLTRAEVERVAMLARLRLTDDEAAEFTVQLEQILGYMATLNGLDTSAIEPFTHVSADGSAFRDDTVINQPNADQILANAPDRDATFFKVPKILE
jgi:aspartyl-tRNA(Asn)/glutamyl-tRNA(Gln) amidotransferase subunit C